MKLGKASQRQSINGLVLLILSRYLTIFTFQCPKLILGKSFLHLLLNMLPWTTETSKAHVLPGYSTIPRRGGQGVLPLCDNINVARTSVRSSVRTPLLEDDRESCVWILSENVFRTSYWPLPSAELRDVLFCFHFRFTDNVPVNQTYLTKA